MTVVRAARSDTQGRTRYVASGLTWRAGPARIPLTATVARIFTILKDDGHREPSHTQKRMKKFAIAPPFRGGKIHGPPPGGNLAVPLPPGGSYQQGIRLVWEGTHSSESRLGPLQGSSSNLRHERAVWELSKGAYALLASGTTALTSKTLRV